MFRTMRLSVALFIQSVTILHAQDINWDKTQVDDSVETRIGTDPSSGFPIFESNVEISCSLHEAFNLLTDYEKLHSFVYGVSDSKQLKTESDSVFVFYQLDLPWPVRDKYAVAYEEYKISESEIIIEIKSVNHPHKVDGLSKIMHLHTDWELRQINSSTTHITYRSTADPMGIPNWVVKIFLANSPKETLKKIRTELETR